eukprot:gene21818-26254_t
MPTATVSPSTFAPSTSPTIQPLVAADLHYGASSTAYLMVNPWSWPSGDWTLECWVYPFISTESRYWLGYATEAHAHANTFVLHHNFPATEQWQHVALVWHAASRGFGLFVDGAEAPDMAHSLNTDYVNGGSLVIGQEQDSVGGRFDQNQASHILVGQIFVVESARTQVEVLNDGASACPFPRVRLYAGWLLKEFSGTDVSGNGRNMTISSGVAPAVGRNADCDAAFEITITSPTSPMGELGGHAEFDVLRHVS